MYWFQ
jgi:hypothetical protein